ncbi:hypothetical protein ACFJGV_15080 [Cnuibacter sp. UC19_7]|uniref:hypothetical protein n=1 Tax=Cnuibacter sp. UC19_7 TaxID=3350166 RepID=UPI00366B20FD
MAFAGYAPAVPIDRTPHCCSRCRTPYNCGNAGCACHAPAQIPVLERPSDAWASWDQVIDALPDLSPAMNRLLAYDPREFQTRWCVRHLVIIPTTKESA